MSCTGLTLICETARDHENVGLVCNRYVVAPKHAFAIMMHPVNRGGLRAADGRMRTTGKNPRRAGGVAKTGVQRI